MDDTLVWRHHLNSVIKDIVRLKQEDILKGRINYDVYYGSCTCDIPEEYAQYMTTFD